MDKVRSLAMAVAALGAGVAFGRCVETPTSVRLERDGRTVWELVTECPEGRPYVHPLSFPDGTVATGLRPKDHSWHLGLWFSWKFVNGLNFWEPSVAGGSEPEGMTRVLSRRVAAEGDAATVVLELEYAPRARPAERLLAERRTIAFSAPEADGAYEILAHHVFTAARDVVLDRTPLRTVQDGSFRGGYAGFALRLRDDVAAEATADLSRPHIAAFECGRHGVLTVEEIGGTAMSGTCLWGDRRFGSLSPVRAGKVSLKAGEELVLTYRVRMARARTETVRPFLPVRREGGYPVRGDRLKAGYKDDRENGGAIAISPIAERASCEIRRIVVPTEIPGVTETGAEIVAGKGDVRLDRMDPLYFSRQLHGESVRVETCHGEWAGEREIGESVLRRGTELVIGSTSGIRGDYGFLAYADEIWASDNSDALDRVFIQWSALKYFPSAAIASHVTAVPNALTHRAIPLKYRFDVAMSCRLGLELVPSSLTAEERAYAKARIADYKRIRPIVQRGEYWPLVSPHERDFAALMYVLEDRAVVFVYRVRGTGRLEAKFRLDGFDGRELAVPLEGERLGGDGSQPILI